LGNPKRQPSVLISRSDEFAIGAVTTARELDIQVPEELSITGIDGHLFGETFGLTTMN
jgi:DNA-binding LacI/PurR family transcriptional regulator